LPEAFAVGNSRLEVLQLVGLGTWRVPVNSCAIPPEFTFTLVPRDIALSRSAADRDVVKVRQHFVAKGFAPRLQLYRTRT
jgi:hypothetical protein